jgi:hypothetical protein
MRKVWEKFELYIVSLWLLFVLIIVVTVDIPFCFGNGCEFLGFWRIISINIVPLVSLMVILFGLLFCARFNHKVSGAGSIPVEISSVKDLNYEHLTFLTTYIVPLICFNLSSVRYLVTLAVLLVVIGIIYVRTDRFYANPTLALLGFRLYSAKMTRRNGVESEVVIISKDRLKSDDMISFLYLDENVLYARGYK